MNCICTLELSGNVAIGKFCYNVQHTRELEPERSTMQDYDAG